MNKATRDQLGCLILLVLFVYLFYKYLGGGGL